MTVPVSYDPVDDERHATHVRIPMHLYRQVFICIQDLPNRQVGALVNHLLANVHLLRERAATAPPIVAAVPDTEAR